MVEKDLQRMFTRWVRENPPEGSQVWELKIIKGTSISFDRVATHQVEALQKVKREGLYHKISDTPFGHSTGFRFHIPKPFDCLFIKSDAFVVLLFYEPRQTKYLIFIDIDDWVDESKRSNRKSLTYQRAVEINKKIIKI